MGRHGWDSDAGGSPAQLAPQPDAATWASGADDEALAPWDRPGAAADRARGAYRSAGRRWAVRGCLVLVLAAAAVVGFRLATGQAQVSPSEVPPLASAPERSPAPSATAEPAASAPAEDARAASSGAPSASGADRLVVHVAGAVKRPGVYRVPAGARVSDAVAKAGGALPTAQLDAVNLAAVIVDGTQLRIPARGEQQRAGPYAAQGGAAPAPSDSGGDTAGGTGGAPAAPVRINSASAQELEQLPGIGPALAQRLIAFRNEHGRFAGEADLDAVEGIGPAMLAKLRGSVSYD
jgi:competence protein ComEA